MRLFKRHKPPEATTVRSAEAKAFWHKVACVPGCGGCCPKDCQRFSQETRLCRVHPQPGATTAETEHNLAVAYEQQFGHGCDLGPYALFSWYHGCPVVITILEKMLGQRIETFYNSRGQSVLTDNDQTLELTQKARGFGLVPGESWPPAECVRRDVDTIYSEVKAELTPVLSQGIRHWR